MVITVELYNSRDEHTQRQCHYCEIITQNCHYVIYADHAPLLLPLNHAVIKLYDEKQNELSVYTCIDGICMLKNNFIELFFITE